VSFRAAAGGEESAFPGIFCEMQIPRFARDDSQKHFFNKLLVICTEDLCVPTGNREITQSRNHEMASMA